MSELRDEEHVTGGVSGAVVCTSATRSQALSNGIAEVYLELEQP